MKTTHNKGATLRTLAAGLAVAVILSGCSDGPSATFEDEATNQAVATQDEATPAPTGGDAETNESAAAAGVDPQTLADPIGTVTVPARVKGDPEASLDVSIHELRRDGDLLIGVFSFTLDTVQPEYSQTLFLTFGRFWAPHLIDPVNLTRHDVVGSKPNEAMTDSSAARISAGQVTYGYAAFAAPPQDVTSMVVQLIEGGAPVTVEISQ